MVDFRLAAKSFIVNNGKLLVLKRRPNDVHKPSIWEIPGGRLNLGEDPIKGLKRETKEETGLDIEVHHPINVSHFTRDDNQKITMLVFLCKANSKDIKLSEEHTDYDWIPLENCKEKLSDFFHREVDVFNKLELNKLL